MIYNEGIVYLCQLVNTAAAGDAPAMKLHRVGRYWFAARTIGLNRQYAAKSVNEQVDMLLRIHYAPEARIGMFAQLGNGEQYRITNATPITDDDTGLRATELTLERLEDFYDVQPEA